MLSQLVLGYVVALPAIVALLLSCLDPGQPFTLVVKMSAVATGPIQVFYDTGAGFSEAQSVTAPLQVAGPSREYELPLPSGNYRRLRVDPGTSAGLYAIEYVEIRTCGGWRTTSVIPLTELVPIYDLAVITRLRDRVVLEAPAGSNDPQLVYTPAAPLILVPNQGRIAWLSVRFAGLWAFGTLVVCGVERVLRPAGPVLWRAAKGALAAAQQSPRVALAGIVLVSTIVSTYPLVFLGRSLASTNYGTPLLYDRPPYAPGAIDFEFEDVRGSDVGATMWQGIPHAHVQQEAIAQGEIPLWNRYNAIGRPLWGQGLTFILDPLHWLTLVVSDPAMGWDLKFVAHRFVFATGIGVAAFVATGAWLPSAIVAAGAPFTGMNAYRFNHPAIFSLTYAPWVLCSWFLLARAMNHRQRLWAAILLAMTSSLVLIASTPKEGAITLLGTEASGALAVILARGPIRERLLRLGMAGLAGVIVVLLTMPHWFIFLQTLGSSATNYDTPYVLVAGRSHAVGLFLGPLMPGIPPPALHLLALALVIAAVSSPRQLVRYPAVLACAIGAIVLVAIAFGAVPESWLIRIPLVRNVGHLDDACLSAAVPLLLLLSAAGADLLLDGGVRRTWLVTLLTAITCGWVVVQVRAIAPGSFEPWAVLLMSPIAVALPGCLLGARGRLLSCAAAAAAVAALLLPGGLHVESGRTPLDRILMQPRPRPALDENSPAVDSVHRFSAAPARAVGIDHVLFPGSQALYELEGLGGADPLEVPAYRELVDAAGITRDWYWLTLVTAPNLERLTPLLDMLNVGFLLARPDALPPGLHPIAMQGGDLVRAVERTTEWPRAFFVDGVTTFADAADLLRKVKEHGEPFAAVRPDDSSAVEATRPLAAPSGLVVPAKDYSLTMNTTTFHLRVPTSGVAVLGETFLPNDFRATLNGRAVEYFRVNHVFKAVVIPAAGDWEIRFEDPTCALEGGVAGRTRWRSSADRRSVGDRGPLPHRRRREPEHGRPAEPTCRSSGLIGELASSQRHRAGCPSASTRHTQCQSTTAVRSRRPRPRRPDGDRVDREPGGHVPCHYPRGRQPDCHCHVGTCGAAILRGQVVARHACDTRPVQCRRYGSPRRLRRCCRGCGVWRRGQLAATACRLRIAPARGRVDGRALRGSVFSEAVLDVPKPCHGTLLGSVGR